MPDNGITERKSLSHCNLHKGRIMSIKLSNLTNVNNSLSIEAEKFWFLAIIEQNDRSLKETTKFTLVGKHDLENGNVVIICKGEGYSKRSHVATFILEKLNEGLTSAIEIVKPERNTSKVNEFYSLVNSKLTKSDLVKAVTNELPIIPVAILKAMFTQFAVSKQDDSLMSYWVLDKTFDLIKVKNYCLSLTEDNSIKTEIEDYLTMSNLYFDSEQQPDTQSEPVTETEPDTVTETEPDSEPETEPETEPEQTDSDRYTLARELQDKNLENFTKDQLLELADRLECWVKKSLRKEDMIFKLQDHCKAIVVNKQEIETENEQQAQVVKVIKQ